jgi:hypothetical protein
MPGSLTTRSQTASRDGETARVAFGVRHTLGAPDGITIAAQWLAYAHPYRRFASVLADRRARLGADVGRYSFIAEDLHLLSPTGLPAHARIIHERGTVTATSLVRPDLGWPNAPRRHHRSASSSAFASRRSDVSKPSVNQP